MAAVAGIYLHYRGAGFIYPFGIQHGLLVAFYDEIIEVLTGFLNGPFQEACYPGSRRTDEVQGQYVTGFKISAVPLSQKVILAQNILFKLYFPAIVIMTVRMRMPMCVIMFMFMIM